MIILINILAFISAFCMFLWIASLLVVIRSQKRSLVTGYSLLNAHPVGNLVRAVAKLNSRQSFSSLCRNIEKQLLYAGKPGGEVSGEEYLAGVEIAGITAFMLLAMMFGIAGVTPVTIIAISLIGGIAISWLVYAWLDNLVVDRRKSISRQFPYFMDLAVMTMEAGSSFLETIELYIHDNPKQAISEEFRVVLHEIRMGKNFEEAMQQLHERIVSEEVQNAINALLQGSRMGTPLGQVLRDQADSLRFKRTQMAEREAEELKVKIMGPVVLMMISVFLLILGPVFVSISTSGIL